MGNGEGMRRAIALTRRSTQGEDACRGIFHVHTRSDKAAIKAGVVVAQAGNQSECRRWLECVLCIYPGGGFCRRPGRSIGTTKIGIIQSYKIMDKVYKSSINRRIPAFLRPCSSRNSRGDIPVTCLNCELRCAGLLYPSSQAISLSVSS